MGLKEILQRNPNLTLADLQELQTEYDRRFVDQKFDTSLQKVEHTYAHMGKLFGRLADYVERAEEGQQVSPEDIRTKVIPDLLVYAAWLAREFNVDIQQAYLDRFIGNLKRLYSNKVPQSEMQELEELTKKK